MQIQLEKKEEKKERERRKAIVVLLFGDVVGVHKKKCCEHQTLRVAAGKRGLDLDGDVKLITSDLPRNTSFLHTRCISCCCCCSSIRF